LSRCQEVNDVYEIEEEMIDRFGSLDTNTKQFLSIIIAKILSAQKEIKSISSYGDNITFVYENDTKKLIKSKSKDEDDIIDTTLKYLRKKS
jgi:transcription-repair coupling factor (superfamily II helicase)